MELTPSKGTKPFVKELCPNNNNENSNLNLKPKKAATYYRNLP